METLQPIKDQQTVTADWESVEALIAGVNIKKLPPIQDERGEICEIYRPSWGIHDAPLTYIYQSSLWPKKIKGWVIHYQQDDRIFVSIGTVRWVLYDVRQDSSTYQKLNVFVVSDRNRKIFTIPAGVYHAVENVGNVEAIFINMPTKPYNYENPDKYRLPLENDLIPFSFKTSGGL